MSLFFIKMEPIRTESLNVIKPNCSSGYKNVENALLLEEKLCFPAKEITLKLTVH